MPRKYGRKRVMQGMEGGVTRKAGYKPPTKECVCWKPTVLNYALGAESAGLAF